VSKGAKMLERLFLRTRHCLAMNETFKNDAQNSYKAPLLRALLHKVAGIQVLRKARIGAMFPYSGTEKIPTPNP